MKSRILSLDTWVFATLAFLYVAVYEDLKGITIVSCLIFYLLIDLFRLWESLQAGSCVSNGLSRQDDADSAFDLYGHGAASRIVDRPASDDWLSADGSKGNCKSKLRSTLCGRAKARMGRITRTRR